MLGALYYEGEEYEFNFSKFWTLAKTKFKCTVIDKEVIWQITLSNRKNVIEIDAGCLIKDIILINYESPDGQKRHNNLYNGGNGIGEIKLYKKIGKYKKLIDTIKAYDIGCEYGEYN